MEGIWVIIWTMPNAKTCHYTKSLSQVRCGRAHVKYVRNWVSHVRANPNHLASRSARTLAPLSSGAGRFSQSNKGMLVSLPTERCPTCPLGPGVGPKR